MWTPKTRLKLARSSAPVLRTFEPSSRAVLTKRHRSGSNPDADGRVEQHPVASRERNYPEILAVVHALRVFKHFLLESKHLGQTIASLILACERTTKQSRGRVARRGATRRTRCRAVTVALRTATALLPRQGTRTRRVSRSCFLGWGATPRPLPRPLPRQYSPPFAPGGRRRREAAAAGQEGGAIHSKRLKEKGGFPLV